MPDLYLQDEDTGVAEEAANALQSLALHPDKLCKVLAEGDCREALEGVLVEHDATVRSRGLACLIACASASSDAAQVVIASGALLLASNSRVSARLHDVGKRAKANVAQACLLEF